MKTATRVMIIEDDLAIAELHHKYLSQLSGLEVVGIATTRMEAEMQLEILNPDLLLMDVYLPDGTGLEILNTLRAKNQTCDVILITAARDVDTLQTAMRGGVVDYLLKPIMFPRLEVALKSILRSVSVLISLAAWIRVRLIRCFSRTILLTQAQNVCQKGLIV